MLLKVERLQYTGTMDIDLVSIVSVDMEWRKNLFLTTHFEHRLINKRTFHHFTRHASLASC